MGDMENRAERVEESASWARMSPKTFGKVLNIIKDDPTHANLSFRRGVGISVPELSEILNDFGIPTDSLTSYAAHPIIRTHVTRKKLIEIYSTPDETRAVEVVSAKWIYSGNGEVVVIPSLSEVRISYDSGTPEPDYIGRIRRGIDNKVGGVNMTVRKFNQVTKRDLEEGLLQDPTLRMR